MDEKHLREKYGIDDGDWERTPVSVRMILLLLGKKIEELEGHLKEIKDLKEQLNEKITRNSENSHSPPGSDPIGFGSSRKKKPKGKKRRGQPGHLGHSRPLYPVEACERVSDYYPERCKGCGEPLKGVRPVAVCYGRRVRADQ